MPNVSDILADIQISRALLLQRVSNGLSKEVAEVYQGVIDKVVRSIKLEDNISLRRMNKLIKELKLEIQPDLRIYTQLQDLAIQERDFTVGATNATLGFNIFSSVPKESTIINLVNTSLMEGATISSWFKSLDASMQTDLDRQIKIGVTSGETTSEIAKRVKDSLDTNKKNAIAITRTAVATVSNEARNKVYEANDDVIKGYEHNSVLDGRTSKICSPRDGAVWSKDGVPQNDIAKPFKMRTPPLHFNCRSTLLPVTKSWQELGIEADEIPPSTRASMDGEVSSGVTFESWIKTKPKSFQREYLGDGRYELFKDGKITLRDLTTQSGRELSLSELKEKYG